MMLNGKSAVSCAPTPTVLVSWVMPENANMPGTFAVLPIVMWYEPSARSVNEKEPFASVTCVIVSRTKMPSSRIDTPAMVTFDSSPVLRMLSLENSSMNSEPLIEAVVTSEPSNVTTSEAPVASVTLADVVPKSYDAVFGFVISTV